MIGLAKFVEEHHGAIEYDLLKKTGHEINDIGDTLSWGALSSFVSNMEADSATVREIEPELSGWSSVAKTNAILADIFDVLSAINSNLKAIGSGTRAKSPEKYPRPKKKTEKNKIFKSSMPMAEMRAWIEERRRRHAGND
jgi:hypothetical protein